MLLIYNSGSFCDVRVRVRYANQLILVTHSTVLAQAQCVVYTYTQQNATQ